MVGMKFRKKISTAQNSARSSPTAFMTTHETAPVTTDSRVLTHR